LSEEKTVFVRKTTGLVRELTVWDSILYSVAGGSGLGLLFVLLFLCLYPGADPILASLITIILILPYLFCYAFLISSMPRSGGDYIFISRIIHPLFGSIAGISALIVGAIFFALSLNWVSTMGLSMALSTMGLITNSPSLISWGALMYDPKWIMFIGTIFWTVAVALSMLGTKRSFRVFNVIITIAIISLFITFLLCAVNSRATFISRFNGYSSSITGDPDYYHTVIERANTLGYDSAAKFSWQNTVLFIPWLCLSFLTLQTFNVLAGEIKNIRKNSFIGLIGGLVVFGGLGTGVLWQVLRVGGYEFINSISYVFLAGDYPFKVPAYFPFFVSMLTDNVLLLAIINFGFMCWVLYMPWLNLTMCSRYAFALAFDRVLPAKMAHVSDKYHTPTYTILFISIVAYIIFLLYTGPLYSLLGVLSVSVVLIGFIYVFVALSAIKFPFGKTKKIYELSPIKYEIGPVPVISILGAFTLGFMVFLLYLLLKYDVYACNSTLSLSFLGALAVFSVVYYYAMRAYRKKKEDIDIDLAFEELPSV
jgi:amino acid transporter